MNEEVKSFMPKHLKFHDKVFSAAGCNSGTVDGVCGCKEEGKKDITKGNALSGERLSSRPCINTYQHWHTFQPRCERPYANQERQLLKSVDGTVPDVRNRTSDGDVLGDVPDPSLLAGPGRFPDHWRE